MGALLPPCPGRCVPPPSSTIVGSPPAVRPCGLMPRTSPPAAPPIGQCRAEPQQRCLARRDGVVGPVCVNPRPSASRRAYLIEAPPDWCHARGSRKLRPPRPPRTSNRIRLGPVTRLPWALLTGRVGALGWASELPDSTHSAKVTWPREWSCQAPSLTLASSAVGGALGGTRGGRSRCRRSVAGPRGRGSRPRTECRRRRWSGS